MLIYLLFLISVFKPIQSVTLQPVQCSSNCESYCSMYASSECMDCLQLFQQTYSLTDKQCYCFSGYVPSINGAYYCCPENCKTCGLYGCSECWNHAIIRYTHEYLFICQCSENYFQYEYHCKCLSFQQPFNYYYDRQLNLCMMCPLDCVCSDDGCVSCNNSTNRNMRINKFNISTCHCINDLVQNNGVCSCPDKCQCENGRIVSCSKQSYRVRSYGKYLCSTYFQQQNATCVCDLTLQLYFFGVDPYENYVCQCNSKNWSKSALYFVNQKGECSICPDECICDISGCYYCYENDFVESIDGICYCKGNYTMSHGNCECIGLFQQLTIELPNSSFIYPCVCLSEAQPTNYYYIKQSFSCLRCPKGCTCNDKGCISCPAILMRTIAPLSDGQYSCSCSSKTFQTQDNICQCSYMYVYDQSTQSCICDTQKLNFTFQDPDQDTCQQCPVECLCSSVGCYFCENYVLRNISVNSEGRSTCHCVNNTVRLSSGICGCQAPYVYNKSSLVCECTDPYEMNVQGQCVCKSFTNWSSYYFDSSNNICYACPFDCICDYNGCSECSDASLRFTMITTNNYSICPCITPAYFYDGNCIICNNDSYFYSGYCVECTQCKTCNKNGCLSCDDDKYLYNYRCYCNYPILENMAGKCTCFRGYYFNPNSDQCIVCPKYCNECFLNIKTGLIECLSCKKQVNRIDVPSDRCKCQQGYLQTFPMSDYCCQIGCFECNQTGCTSCSDHTYRILENNSCVCPPEMVEKKYLCDCFDGWYLFDATCHECPLNCQTCHYNFENDGVECLQCANDANRNTNPPNCTCIQYFKETFPTKRRFCVEEYCLNEEVNCTKCKTPFLVSEYFYCLCPDGTYFSYHFVCEACSIIPGCLQCSTPSICFQCDQTQGYYLSFYKCIFVNVYQFVQTSNQKQIVIQFNPEIKIQKIISIQSVIGKPIYSKINVRLDQVIEPFYFEEYSVDLQTYLMTVKVKIENDYNSSILAISGTFEDQQGSSIDHTFNIKTILTSYASPLSASEMVLIFCFGGIALGIGYVIYVMGYKHNQLIFLIQTICFSAFKINNSLLPSIYFGYYLKLCYYNFGLDRLQLFIYKNNYFEQSHGNYHFLTTDANIFRIAGMPIVLAFANLIIITFKLLLLAFSLNLLGRIQRLRYAKIFFRTLEFIYKTTMYPLIFFSLQMVATWNRGGLGESREIFVANIFSTSLLSLFFVTTIIQYLSVVTSNFYKRQALSEYISCIGCSASLIFCGETYWIIPVCIVLFLRNMFYYYTRQKYLRDNSIKRISNYSITIISLASIVLMIFPIRPYALMTLLVIVIVLYCLHACFLLSNYDKQRESDKQKGSIECEKSSSVQIIE